VAHPGAFFEASGFAVLNAEGLGLAADHATGAVPQRTVYDLVCRGDRREADGIFISCTSLRAIGPRQESGCRSRESQPEVDDAEHGSAA
jgi:maleate cis-trans isomerase